MNPLASAQRLDPYKNFKFRLKYDGRYVYGGNQATGLTILPSDGELPVRRRSSRVAT